MQSRRTFLTVLAGLAAATASDASPDLLDSRTPPDLETLDLEVGGDAKLATRMTLFVPKKLAKDERIPLLVLLPGLAETSSPEIGVYAWVERYGLGRAYAAACGKPGFRGMAVACPYMPNTPMIDAYVDWIADVVVPRARKEVPAIKAVAAATGIDGVSRGGTIAMEAFVRRPECYAAVGGIQSGYWDSRLDYYVKKLGETRPHIHLETSETDVFRPVNERFAALLTKGAVPHDFVVLPGAHDQAFLRERGTLEMLLWHDRRLRST